MLELQSVGYVPRRFGPVSLSLGSGELVLLCGLSGSGKSTLCELLCDRLEPSFGQIVVGPGFEVGYIAQDFENQLLGASVSQELELGRRCGQLRGREGHPEFHLRTEESWGCRDPHLLSAGEQQAVLLESLCLSGASLFILDESLSWLDHQTLKAVLEQLRQMCRSGGTVLIVSHDLRVLPFVDRVLGLEKGALSADLCRSEVGREHLLRFGLWLGSLESGFRSKGSEVTREQELAAQSQGTKVAWEALPGAWACLVGRSGSGKSRFLASVIGLTGAGVTQDPLGLGGSMALLPQRAESILFRRTVEQELTASLQFGGEDIPVDVEIGSLIPTDWLQRNPRHLSAGQIRYLACLCLILQMPSTLLLDEPFTGLDAQLRGRLHLALTRYLATGRRLLMATRHPDEVLLYGSEVMLIEKGQKQGDSISQAELDEVLGPPLVSDPGLSNFMT